MEKRTLTYVYVQACVGLVKITINPLLIVLRKINSIQLNKHVQSEPIQSFNFNH